MTFFLFFFFLLGLIIGSFLNVVVVRLRSGESLLGRSRCPRCGKTISWYDNVPLLSFLLLRRRCRQCGKKIAWQYPLTELATGLLFAATAWQVFDIQDPESAWRVGFYLVLFSLLMVILVYDALYMEIPLVLVWAGVVWVVFSWFIGNEARMPGEWLGYSTWITYVLSGVGAAFCFAMLSFFSRERWMGWGDAHLVFLLGLAAGFPGILWSVTLGSGLGSLVGIAAVLQRTREWGSRIPFGPFLIVGYWIVFFSNFFTDRL